MLDTIDTLLRRRRTLVGIVVVIMIAGAALALASRRSAEKEPPLNTHSFEGRVTIGAVLDLGNGADREAQRGLELWKDKIDTTRGIPVGASDLVPVHLEFRDSEGSAEEAASQARRLVREGAGILIGPVGTKQLEAVARVALDTHTMLISLIPRPTGVPRNRLLTFLSRPRPGSFDTAFDALDVVHEGTRRATERIRVAIVAPVGRWGPRGRSAQVLARSRGYAAKLEHVVSGDPGVALRRARAFEPDLIVVSAPFRTSVRWFRTHGRSSDPPWVVAADDVSEAQAGFRGSRLAVSAPWSPTTSRGGPIFPPREFQTLYRDRFGGLATTDAAASAAAGIVISEAVLTARSTDVARLLAARDRLRTESLWGTLQFVMGEQPDRPPSVVLLTRAGPRSIGPEPADPEQLARSKPVPARTAAAPDGVRP